MSQNQRAFSRINVDVEAEFISTEDEKLTNRVSNVGLNGLFMACDTTLKIGTVGDLTLFIGGRESGLHLKAHGVVARAEDGGIGIKISALDLDSLQHLRHLILYNATDPDKIEQEFKNHFGIK